MLRQNQRTGFDAGDLEPVVREFDRRSDAAGAAAEHQAVDIRRSNGARIAQQDGSEWMHYSAAFVCGANAFPTLRNAAMMSSTSLSVRTGITVSSAARSDNESQTGSRPRS